MTTRLEAETGLRNPTILEAQSADKTLMTIACDLVMEKQWNFDDAIHEITFMRAEINTMLQARPRLPKQTYQRLESSAPKGIGKSQRATPYSKGKTGKGSNKGASKSSGKVNWITETTVNGAKKQLCMRFQSGKCDLGSSCRFHHGCAYPMPSGEACGKNHGAMTHDKTPHWPQDFETRSNYGSAADHQTPDHGPMVITGFTNSGILPSASSFSPSHDPPPRGDVSAMVPDVVDADPATDHGQYWPPKEDLVHHPPLVHAPDNEASTAVDNSGTAIHLSAEPQASPQSSLDSKFTLPVTGMRCFLDICCGVNSPLSKAVQLLHGDVMRFDILVHSSDDLLDNTAYENLLRVCSSGIVAYAGASPSCCEYSRLKLLPHGPPALRTPDFLDGVPGLTSSDLLKVQESHTMLARCITCLQIVVSAGGHSHLEQPKTAMSWDEPIVQQFISQHGCACISIAACGYGKDWHKHWLLASTFSALAKLACACDHAPGSHQPIAGVRTESGQFLSRATAEYPESLAQSFAQIILPLLSDQKLELNLDNYENYLPIKNLSDPPFSRQDGAGFPSQADWSSQHSFED